MLHNLRKHLSWKLFVSYLVVMLVGVVILAGTAEWVAPSAFDRHLAAMGELMQSMMISNMMEGADTNLTNIDLNADLFNNFRDAITEALLVSIGVATLAAIVVSIFVSQQVVDPVRAVIAVTKRIAAGEYNQRVEVHASNPDDTDEIGQLAIQFNRMASQLEKLEDARRQLIADVSHELRTPLTSIKGYMEGLLDDVLPANEATYNQVLQEADRLARLVDDLQELSRLEAGDFELNRTHLEIPPLLQKALNNILPLAKAKGITLTLDCAQNLPQVLADRDRILQVILNLLSNALRYTPSRGEVWITAKQERNNVFIAVHDSGIGIPTPHLLRIFTRFYRVDKSRSREQGGSGIGLTIAQRLVEAHGGRIWAESPGEGKGSTFAFTLPTGTQAAE